MKRSLPQFSETRWFVLIIALFMATVGPGRIEGSIYPAAAPMVLAKAIEGPQVTFGNQRMPSVLFWGSSAVLRGGCSPRRLDWHLGPRAGRNVEVPVNWGPPKLRDAGAFDFGPWVMGGLSDPGVFERRTFGDVLHQCGITIGGTRLDFPWLTRSRFWN